MPAHRLRCCRCAKEISARLTTQRADHLYIAAFAAYHCQIRALKLKPWNAPPCVASEDNPDERDKDAQKLLRKMLAAGVSRYAPDPMAALAKSRRA